MSLAELPSVDSGGDDELDNDIAYEYLDSAAKEVEPQEPKSASILDNLIKQE